MRVTATLTFIVVLGIYAGGALVIASTPWWHVIVLAPSMIAALWTATRWHTPAPPLAIAGALVLGEATWAVAATLAISPAAAFGISVTGAVTVSKLSRKKGVAAAVLVSIVLATGLLVLIRYPEQAPGYLLVAPIVTVVFVAVFWVNHTAWQLFAELDSTRRAETELALVKERFRFAADLHDIQGHTLHVVKLKAALAERLLRTDPASAEDELRQVQDLIAETIVQTRSIAYGQQKITVAGELENAKNLFEAAGINVRVTSDGDPAAAIDEYVSLVLREATTNILRHAQATHVAIIVAPNGISISNDGIPTGPLPDLHGLAVLDQRITGAGGALEVVKTANQFVTAVTFDLPNHQEHP
ncbi:sensor histidine kinase [Microbacterium marinilacus]|nr:sensor histidine kinase [Microbacterium marinilacus]